MKKYKVRIYQMGMPATEIIIETARPPSYFDKTIYFFAQEKDGNGNSEVLASFPTSITSIQLID